MAWVCHACGRLRELCLAGKAVRKTTENARRLICAIQSVAPSQVLTPCFRECPASELRNHARRLRRRAFHLTRLRWWAFVESNVLIVILSDGELAMEVSAILGT